MNLCRHDPAETYAETSAETAETSAESFNHCRNFRRNCTNLCRKLTSAETAESLTSAETDRRNKNGANFRYQKTVRFSTVSSEIAQRDFEIECPSEGPWDDEVHWHGCNPYAVTDILDGGFLPTKGKGYNDYGLGTYTSKFYYTAYQYPMCICTQDKQHYLGVSVCPRGPKVRIILKCKTNHQRIIANWSGNNKQLSDGTTKKTNNQQLYPPDAVMVSEIIIHCVEPSPLRGEMMPMFQRLKRKRPDKYERIQRRAGELLTSPSKGPCIEGALVFPDLLPLDDPFIVLLPPVAQPRPTKKSRGSNELLEID